MARKHNRPLKKKNRTIAQARPRSEGTPMIAPTAVSEFSMARPVSPKNNPTVVAAIEAVKYENLSGELLRVALLTAGCVIILIIAWLILR